MDLLLLYVGHWNTLQWQREKEGDDIIEDIWDAALMQERTETFFAVTT